MTRYLPMPRQRYPQPLTFDVEDYPGYALQPIEFELLSADGGK